MSAAPSAEISVALAAARIRPARFVLLSPLGPAKGRRLAYRVDATDGRCVKVRQFESVEIAEEIHELRRDLESAFAPILTRVGSVVVEEWIEGVELTAEQAAQRVEEAGRMLGRLHRHPLPTGQPATICTQTWRAGADADVETLAGAGALEAPEAVRLHAELATRDPVHAFAALVHLDFCAENMVLDRHGALRVVDNEQIAIEPAGVDLGRTFHRWPMSPAAWADFRTGYRSSGARDPGAAGFWRLVATLVGCRVYRQRSPERLATSLALLRRLLLPRMLPD